MKKRYREERTEWERERRRFFEERGIKREEVEERSREDEN